MKSMQSISPQERRALVVELIQEGLGTSQQALVDALAGRGVSVTQATLSRDLRELGAVKGPDGYSVAGASADPLVRGLRQWLRAATPAQNLVVLRTPPGGASPLGVVLDAHGPASIVGTIAGDDTIMVVTPSSAAAAQLALDFGRHAGGGDR